MAKLSLYLVGMAFGVFLMGSPVVAAALCAIGMIAAAISLAGMLFG
jgi:hypothetical protein